MTGTQGSLWLHFKYSPGGAWEPYGIMGIEAKSVASKAMPKSL